MSKNQIEHIPMSVNARARSRNKPAGELKYICTPIDKYWYLKPDPFSRAHPVYSMALYVRFSQ